MKFDELRLAEPIVRAVAARGYTTPTPIQQQAIPVALSGSDVLGCAQTGTGKTGAFALPILHRLAKPASSKRPRSQPRALVLCPTRELAAQIGESFAGYGRDLRLRHVVIFGGVGQGGQVRGLRAGADIIVATPGRLLDLIGQGHVDLSAIETLVLDEADRMLDMGFIHDIRRIIECIPRRRQTMLFSATMPPEIRRLADSILREPRLVQVSEIASTGDAIDQTVFHVARKNKPVLLQRLIRDDDMKRTLVFTRTKHGADRLVRVLKRSGIEAGAIHGNKSQGARTRALGGFKAGRTPVLVATDIAARGIDVDEITHVINFDIPNIPETYVHRIGRTARAGASGIALSFCDRDEISDLRAIERLIDLRLTVSESASDLALKAPPATRARAERPQREKTAAARRPRRRRPRRSAA
jgi:ATP-dependent RNA helicase RhlE